MEPSSFPCYPIGEIAEDPFAGRSLSPVLDASFLEIAWDVAGDLEQTLNAALVDFLEVGTLELALTFLTRLETAFVGSDLQIEQESVVGEMAFAWPY